jgi:hypothetical protein
MQLGVAFLLGQSPLDKRDLVQTGRLPFADATNLGERTIAIAPIEPKKLHQRCPHATTSTNRARCCPSSHVAPRLGMDGLHHLSAFIAEGLRYVCTSRLHRPPAHLRSQIPRDLVLCPTQLA